MSVKRFINQVAVIAVGFFVSLMVLCSIVVFGFLKLTTQNPKKVDNNSVLAFNMAGKIVERIPSALFGSNQGIIDLKVVSQVIQQATKDSRIAAIYLNLSSLSGGLAVLEEIREALLEFKRQGKTIIAYADGFTQGAYYLASAADEIILNPIGCLEFKGFSATVDFYTKLFQNISIQPIIFRVGACKDAVEPFCLTKMSAESRQQKNEYLQSFYDHFLLKIGSARNIAVPVLKQHANDLSAVLPDDAIRAGLITRIGSKADAKKLLKEKLKSPAFIKYKAYNASVMPSDLADKKIAVLIAEGVIWNGPSSAGYIGAHDFVKTLKGIRKNADIKALVLRINSPGGDVLASDIIWKAIEAFKSVKPVVASMSNVAASGGYQIAAPCHYIFAQPTTITGSIGVFGMLFDPAELMRKIGIHRDVVKTAPSADFLSPRVNCSELEFKCMHKLIQGYYDDFLGKVAKGRGLDLDCVEKLASGRVYTGSAAQRNGLVDELGGLEAAIAKAASLANLTENNYAICYLPRPKTKLEQLRNYTTSRINVELLDALVDAHPILNQYRILSRSNGIQAILPYTIHID